MTPPCTISGHPWCSSFGTNSVIRQSSSIRRFSPRPTGFVLPQPKQCGYALIYSPGTGATSRARFPARQVFLLLWRQGVNGDAHGAQLQSAHLLVDVAGYGIDVWSQGMRFVGQVFHR